MTLSGFIRGGLSVLVGIIALFVLENTVGAEMDKLYIQFNNIVTNLQVGGHLSAGWANVATSTLTGWVWYDRAFVVCIIAMFVWWVSLIFVDVDYTRAQAPRQF